MKCRSRLRNDHNSSASKRPCRNTMDCAFDTGICSSEIKLCHWIVYIIYYTIYSFGNHHALESIIWSMQWSLTFVWLTTFSIRVRLLPYHKSVKLTDALY